MYCSKCGNQVPESAKFCDKCGMGIDQKGAATANPVVSNDAAPTAVRGGLKSRKRLITIVAAVAAVVLAGSLAYANMWKIMPDKTYFGYLESRNKVVSFNQLYKEAIKNTELKPFSKDIEVRLNGFGGFGDMSVAKLQDFTLQTQIDYSSSKSTSYACLKYMDNVLVDAIAYQDKNTLGLGIPVIYGRTFTVKKDEIPEVISDFTGAEIADQSSFDAQTIEQLKKELDADTKLLDKAVSKYSKLVYDEIPSDSVTVTGADGAVSLYTWKNGNARMAMEVENCRIVEIKLSGKDLYGIADKVLSELKKDKQLLERIYYYTRGGGLANLPMPMVLPDKQEDKAAIIERMQTEIEDLRDQLSSSTEADSERILLTMRTVSDGKNNIISREIVTEDGVITLAAYADESGQKVTELNCSQGRFGTGGQLFNLYAFDGKDSKGINASNRFGYVELSHTSAGEGKNKSGIEYGVYKARINTRYEDYDVILSADKDKSSKDADRLDTRILMNGAEMMSLSIDIRELKNKSKLKFDKGKSIDLAKTDQYEIQEIMSEMEANFRNVSNDVMSLFYQY